MIFQEPMTAFSPVHTIGDQIGEVARLHRRLSRLRRATATIEALEAVGFPIRARRLTPTPSSCRGLARSAR